MLYTVFDFGDCSTDICLFVLYRAICFVCCMFFWQVSCLTVIWQNFWTYKMCVCVCVWWAGLCSRYSDWLWARQTGDQIPVGSRFSAPVQTGPGAHPPSCTMGTGTFPGVKSGQDVTLTPHSLLVPWSRKSRAIPLLPLWAIWPVQGCTLPFFTFIYVCMYACIFILL